ncbi:MAG: M24 family metallopeptidase [Chloroflexi bacterium]|nr:M24 family metallopeptidase [Chloroflexota bacterium]
MHWSSSPANRATFTAHERERRWRRLREEMDRQGIDVLVVLPQWLIDDALYVANQSGAVVFPLTGEPTLIIGGEGSNVATAAEGWIADRRSATARGSTRVAYGEAVAARLAELSLPSSARVGIAGLGPSYLVHVRQPEGYANYSTVMRIREVVPQVVDGTGVLAEARHQKSEEELEVMRRAVEVAEASARAIAEHARAGAPQAEVFGQGILAQMRGGAEEQMLSWCAGRWGEPKWRFTSPPPGQIGAESWYILTEIGPSLRGYHCQISEPIVVGQLDPQTREVWELNAAAFRRACELMRSGATWDAVEDGVKNVGRGSGYEIDFLIHGQGLGNEGPMLIPVDTHAPFRGMPMREGSTFVLKPFAYPPGSRFIARQHDVTWGDTIVVRQDGAERLGTRPLSLVVV